MEVATGFHKEDYFVFLDSSQQDSEQGRYSMLAWNPSAVFRPKDSADPIAELGDLLESRRTSGKFQGGAIGYLSYDLFPYIERYGPRKAVDDLGLPDCCIAFYDTILVFDHQTQEWSHDQAQPLAPPSRPWESVANRPVAVQFAPVPKEPYLDAVERALEHIRAGDIYQVNLSQRFCCQTSASPFELFVSLRQTNPSHYGAYLNCKDHVVISSSPELFLKRDGPAIETRPIKGTRPRGKTQADDEALERDLMSSSKDAAELAMIVDLERNDLGRICEYGSVEVVRHRYLERLPTLFHTISTIRGRLREGTGVTDILRAAFPGGSITGCPKIRAIEIIDALEPVRRHVYTGAIGYFGFNGDLNLNIAIRTLVQIGETVYFQTGGGIVADSVPEDEYAEILHKSAAIRTALSASHT